MWILLLTVFIAAAGVKLDNPHVAALDSFKTLQECEAYRVLVEDGVFEPEFKRGDMKLECIPAKKKQTL